MLRKFEKFLVSVLHMKTLFLDDIEGSKPVSEQEESCSRPYLALVPIWMAP